MKSKAKRFFKRLFKIGKIPFLLGIGLFIGLIIGSESGSRHNIFIQTDGRFAEEYARNFEQRLHERLAEEIAIPPIPAVPALPASPAIPEIPPIPAVPDVHANIHIDRGPSFWDVLNGIGTLMASLILILMGGKILIQRWREPKEKSPESVGA